MEVTTLLGIFLLALTSTLIYMVYSFRQELQSLAGKIGDYFSEKKSSNLPQLSSELKEIQECMFLQKYANIPFTKFRTVTLSNAILQASKSKNIAFPEDSKRITLVGNQNISSTNLNTSLKFPSNLKQFEADENNYQESVDGILGYNKLGAACTCPDGSLCNWNPKMFTQFMYNPEIIDLQEIQIFEKQGADYQLLSTSDIQPITSPSGQYAIVIMDNPIAIEAIPLEVELVVVIRWKDTNGESQVVALKNILEIPEEVEVP